MVEQATVNRLVAGSNPARGAKNFHHILALFLLPKNTPFISIEKVK